MLQKYLAVFLFTIAKAQYTNPETNSTKFFSSNPQEIEKINSVCRNSNPGSYCYRAVNDTIDCTPSAIVYCPDDYIEQCALGSFCQQMISPEGYMRGICVNSSSIPPSTASMSMTLTQNPYYPSSDPMLRLHQFTPTMYVETTCIPTTKTMEKSIETVTVTKSVIPQTTTLPKSMICPGVPIPPKTVTICPSPTPLHKKKIIVTTVTVETSYTTSTTQMSIVPSPIATDSTLYNTYVSTLTMTVSTSIPVVTSLTTSESNYHYITVSIGLMNTQTYGQTQTTSKVQSPQMTSYEGATTLSSLSTVPTY
ncbi:hypothetical protein ROZALSC1DRAFT_21138 [Rozella allomycis CSF55]|uniref:Carbohydrate-binding module family 19 domain-containing protein n=1 Tax=Rozella allomycis (strain CSF55) TaxID=988480 RepID=A0A4P9YPU8_ROZAC|nr:hypothetical protein ROZALSC1DRAFT_21138 [Rozella allomycis CSF55]